MADITHGTPSAYANGCGCDDCKSAARRRRQEGTLADYQAGRTKVPPLFDPSDRTQPYDINDPRHGTLSAYTQGCRCVWCRAVGGHYRACKKLGVHFPKGYNARTEIEKGIPL